MTTFGQLEDTDIDVAIDDRDAGERRGMELAARIRMVAAQDPELAQDLVDQLIAALERATGGAFRQFLDSEDEPAVTAEEQSVISPARNS
jgi:hypothetical protein